MLLICYCCLLFVFLGEFPESMSKLIVGNYMRHKSSIPYNPLDICIHYLGRCALLHPFSPLGNKILLFASYYSQTDIVSYSQILLLIYLYLLYIYIVRISVFHLNREIIPFTIKINLIRGA